MLSNFRLSNFGMMRWQAQSDGGTGAGGSSDDGKSNDDQSKGKAKDEGESKSFATFGDWFNSLDDNGKALAGPAKEHFDRVHQTLRTVRDERDEFQKQLKIATSKLKEGSEERVTLEELSTNLDKANQRADFYEEAPSHKCLNPKAAYALAVSESLIDAKKGVDWKALAETAPELFGDAKRKLPNKRSAGDGTDSGRANAVTMNDWIRSQAGAGRITQ